MILQAQHNYSKDDDEERENPFAAFLDSSSDEDESDESDEGSEKRKQQREREKKIQSNVFNWKAPTLGVVNIDDDIN